MPNLGISFVNNEREVHSSPSANRFTNSLSCCCRPPCFFFCVTLAAELTACNDCFWRTVRWYIQLLLKLPPRGVVRTHNSNIKDGHRSLYIYMCLCNWEIGAMMTPATYKVGGAICRSLCNLFSWPTGEWLRTGTAIPSRVKWKIYWCIQGGNKAADRTKWDFSSRLLYMRIYKGRRRIKQHTHNIHQGPICRGSLIIRRWVGVQPGKIETKDWQPARVAAGKHDVARFADSCGTSHAELIICAEPDSSVGRGHWWPQNIQYI